MKLVLFYLYRDIALYKQPYYAMPYYVQQQTPSIIIIAFKSPLSLLRVDF